jgi:hypothetical protein
LPPSHAHCVLGVGDVMFQIGQQVVQMALEHLRHFDHRLEPAPAHPAKPVLKEPLRPNIC